MAYVPAESMFRNHEDSSSHFPSSSPCAPQDFHGVQELLMRRSMSFSGVDRGEEFHADDDVSDDGSQMLGEKKRRLNLEQVKALEKSFESGNKLEPERKLQLARALGLQPRQVSIWFQNRRARWKTKQLEKDYDILKAQFQALKAHNDALKSHNNNLQTQLMGLKSRESTGTGAMAMINLNKENEGSWSNGSDTSCEANLVKTTSATNSALYGHQRSKQHTPAAAIFPPAMGPAALTQPVSNDCFGTMFGGIEETQEFWPWSEHQNFH